MNTPETNAAQAPVEATHVETAPRAPREDRTPPRTFASPLVDVFENDDEYLLVADLPGVTDAEIQLRYEGDILYLEAHRAADQHVFRRTFEVSDRVEADAIEAKLERGVLTVTLPKAASARPRQIPVHVA